MAESERDDPLHTPLTAHTGIEVPLICGPMYPCSNPELVAAASAAGGIGVVQPLSLVHVHGREFRAGLREIRELTDRPIGMNVIVEATVKAYQERMQRYLEIALEEGVRFFVTSLGKPDWVVQMAHASGGIVYHDVTRRKWAQKAVDVGVDGLIAVNRRAGGHAGEADAEVLYEELHDLGVPVVCAGGISDGPGFARALAIGYAGVQMGTRFIATEECTAHGDYKQAVVTSGPDDIVLSERLTGVPLAVIETPYIRRVGTKAGPIARWMLKGHKTKHWMRAIYALRSMASLKRASLRPATSKDVWQAGKSVEHIHAVEPCAAIVARCAEAARHHAGAPAA
ncbi:MAG: nitronate monooxygenase [Acidobacteriota bacterium]